jgi:lysozyme family protein
MERMIVGTGRKTRLVPRGLGPFSTWHEAALDALKREGLTGRSNWTPGAMLAALEPFNGYGYRNKGLRSPYIWASTNHQQPGKYVLMVSFLVDYSTLKSDVRRNLNIWE